MSSNKNIYSLSNRFKSRIFSGDGMIHCVEDGGYEYSIEKSEEIKSALLNLENDEKFKLLCVFHESYFLNKGKKIPILVSNRNNFSTCDYFEAFEFNEAMLRFPDLSEISNRVLILLAQKATFENSFNSIKIIPQTGLFVSQFPDNYEFFFSSNYDQINSTISTLEKANYISVVRSGNNNKILTITLTEEGLKKGCQLSSTKRKSKCFVAMKFGEMSEFNLFDSIGLQYLPKESISKLKKELQEKSSLPIDCKNHDNDKFWKTHIKDFIENEFDIDCIRVDESSNSGEIPSNIKDLISESDFVICDLSYNNNGVYYEAGYAHALNKEVIFICQKNHFPFLHFDIRHYNVLLYKKNEMRKFEKQLSDRIKEILTK